MFFVTAHVINFVNFDAWHFCKPFISRSQLTRCFDQYLGSEISLSISMWLVLLLTGFSGSIEARRSFSYSRFWLCKTCGWIEKKKRKKEKKKNDREVREILGHCTDWLMTCQSYSLHLYSRSSKARRFIQIRTRKKIMTKKSPCGLLN